MTAAGSQPSSDMPARASTDYLSRLRSASATSDTGVRRSQHEVPTGAIDDPAGAPADTRRLKLRPHVASICHLLVRRLTNTCSFGGRPLLRRYSAASANGQRSDRQAGRAERDDGTAFQIVGHGRQVQHEQRGVRLRCEFGDGTKVHDGRADRAAQRQQTREIAIGGHNDTAISGRSIEDFLIASRQQPERSDMDRIEARSDEQPSKPRREVRVQQQLHAGRDKGASRSFTTTDAYSSVAYTSARSR